jgi:cytochrome P450
VPTAHFPPGPRGLPIAGSLLDYRRAPLRFLTGVARDFGDIATIRFGPFKSVLLSHPDLVKEMLVTQNRRFHQGPAHVFLARALGRGLLTSENPLHLRQRRLMQPAFHHQRVAGYGAVMAAYGAQTSDRWRDGASLDVAQEMMRLALAIVGTTLFGTDITTDASLIGRASGVVNAYASDRSTQITGPLLDRLPLPRTRRFYRAKAHLDAFIYELIAARRASGRDHGDLLSMLLDVRDEDGNGMPTEQIRDEAVTLLLAGHETTANALTWTWYLLSQHPAVEAKLHAELDAVLAGRLPAADDLAGLPYTEMVISESLRLYPPAWGTSKLLIEDWSIGRYMLPKGTIVSTVSYLIHRDGRFWSEPERFRPERWTPEAKAARPRFAYFPFGGGPRQCIGEPFAWMEAILLLATIAQRWRLRLEPGHPVVPDPLITLRPRYGMRMVVERRTVAPPASDQSAIARGPMPVAQVVIGGERSATR